MRNTHLHLRAIVGLGFMAVSMLGSSQTVLNGGFEQVNDYPSMPGAIELADHWLNISSASNAPDLFHVLGSDAGDLPETPVAVVMPFQGMAIAGFSPYNILNDGRRQYLGGSFSDALIVGQRYQMTLNMTNGEITAFSNAGLGLAGLGMRFSNGPMEQPGVGAIDVEPHFDYTPVFYNREWQQISFNFVAQEPWTHFTWGLFGNEPGDVTEEHGENPTKVYCFVDGFSLEPSAEMGSDEDDSVRGPEAKPSVSNVDLDEDPHWFVPSAFTPNGDGDNDVFGPVCENVLIQSFEVYSRWGQMIFSGSGNDVGWDGANSEGAPLESGSYVWRLNVIDPEGQLLSKSGSLSLIR